MKYDPLIHKLLEEELAKVRKWSPRASGQKILNYAMVKIKSVPYPVTGRWVFYQLVQAGLVEKKDADNFGYLMNNARKQFYGDWYPGLLTDSVRECDFKGEKGIYFDYFEDTIQDQDTYVQLWFEAEAMHTQFEYYTKDYRVSLVPFRGDPSIPFKWEIAEKLKQILKKYGKPIQILYFGDYDKKGLQIFDSALKDIRLWSLCKVDVERVGLTLEQAQSLNIPDNPNKPNTYQWEALNDAQAGKLIVDAVERYAKKPSDMLLRREAKTKKHCESLILDVLNAQSF
jgi:hypothetical protein